MRAKRFFPYGKEIPSFKENCECICRGVCGNLGEGGAWGRSGLLFSSIREITSHPGYRCG